MLKKINSQEYVPVRDETLAEMNWEIDNQQPQQQSSLTTTTTTTTQVVVGFNALQAEIAL